MDTRLLIIALPLLTAATWALINIGTLAIHVKNLKLKRLQGKIEKYLIFPCFSYIMSLGFNNYL
jgi:hypothetical protein